MSEHGTAFCIVREAVDTVGGVKAKECVSSALMKRDFTFISALDAYSLTYHTPPVSRVSHYQ